MPRKSQHFSCTLLGERGFRKCVLVTQYRRHDNRQLSANILVIINRIFTATVKYLPPSGVVNNYAVYYDHQLYNNV